MTEKIKQFTVTINQKYIKDCILPNPGDTFIYTGPNIRLLNGISDSIKVDIVSGTKLSVCKFQYKNNIISYNSKDEKQIGVKAHISCEGIGEHSDCSCGACGYKWTLIGEPPDCDCDEGCETIEDEICVIM